jgi:hypothetical protein
LSDELSYFEQAADALREAFAATNLGEQAVFLEKALHFHRLAIAEERAKLAQWVRAPPSSDPEPPGADGDT